MSTYGWAILIIAIVLAAFIWLGIFSPKTPEWCSVPGMRCDNAQLVSTTGGQRLSVKLSNQLAERVQICSLYCSAGPVGSNGLPLRNGAAIASARAGGTGCKGWLLANTVTVAGGIIDIPTGPITVTDDTGGAVVVVPGTGGTSIPIGDTGGPVVPGVSEGDTGASGGTAIPGVDEGMVITSSAGSIAYMQGAGDIIADPTVEVWPYVIVVGPVGEDPYLEIGQGKTFMSNTGCLDAQGLPTGLKAGGKYDGKVFVEYVLRDDAKGTPARVLTGEVSTALNAGG